MKHALQFHIPKNLRSTETKSKNAQKKMRFCFNLDVRMLKSQYLNFFPEYYICVCVCVELSHKTSHNFQGWCRKIKCFLCLHSTIKKKRFPTSDICAEFHFNIWKVWESSNPNVSSMAQATHNSDFNKWFINKRIGTTLAQLEECSHLQIITDWMESCQNSPRKEGGRMYPILLEIGHWGRVIPL